MRSLLLYLRFVGTGYCGYQVQKNGVSITQRLQDAIETVFGARLPVKGCSRTDAGVHANMFCVSFQTESTIPCDAVVRALNTNLPYDIAVYDCKEAVLGFHARYDARGKEYCYKFDNGKTRNPFLHGLAYHCRYPLDEKVLNALAQGFVGTYDFAALCAAKSTVKDTVRTVSDCAVAREGDTVTFFVRGDGFLYNMVR
ncbi:MAG: tRNA pseudouridine(38-40) synthase TruA, partial [Acetanaerobacterium sp.]